MTTRSQVVAAALEWIDTPFHHQGRLKGVGVDCAGLLICVAKELSLIPEDWDATGYDRRPDGETLMQYCLEHMQQIPREDMKPGDVVCVRYANYPQHLGFVADYRHGGNSIIHSSSEAGRVIETRLMFSNAFMFVAAFCLPGLED